MRQLRHGSTIGIFCLDFAEERSKRYPEESPCLGSAYNYDVENFLSAILVGMDQTTKPGKKLFPTVLEPSLIPLLG